jgi:GT2 family glycosyltransferase
MNLSVIIVSYNVRYFLEQCLKSVIQASHSLDVDIFVVDNCSEDDSVSMVQTRFPGVKLIINSDNKGFSKANNQAIRLSDSDYVLLLNPDTVLEEDALIKALNFMETHPEAGGLGIKMIDGYGHFLPESKRGLPTPWASFCKMSQLSQLFPHSAYFNHYHLGNLAENETNKIEVLAGAFMLLRRKVLDKIGLLDEDFFMYGEDIDLSIRITKSGSFNYYYPEARMIHYKGESTRKGSLNYVRVFYGAMLIFARKHFAGKNQRLLSLVILPGVYSRAGIAMISRSLNSFSHSSSWSFFSRAINQITPSHFRDTLKSQHPTKKRVALIIANQHEGEQIKGLLNDGATDLVSTFCIAVNNESSECIKNSESLDTLICNRIMTDIRNKMGQYHAGEIIFSAADLSSGQIITLMSRLKDFSIEFRIAHTDNKVIIGSNFVSISQKLAINA